MNVCWNITSSCNKSCRYCFKFKDVDISLDAKKFVLNRLKNLNVKKIVWGGGEPYLVNDIDILLKISHDYGIYNDVITNASLLNKDNLVNKLKNVDKLNISLDFVDDKLNKKYGIGEDCYKHVKELIPLINKYFPDINLQINTVVFKNNIDKLNDIYKELNNYKISSWKLNKFFPVRGSALKNKEKLYITDFEYDKEVSKFLDTKQDFKICFNDEEKMMKKHYIVLSSGKLIVSEDNKDIEVIDLMKDNE